MGLDSRLNSYSTQSLSIICSIGTKHREIENSSSKTYTETQMLSEGSFRKDDFCSSSSL
jgi:hypothetical protein